MVRNFLIGASLVLLGLTAVASERVGSFTVTPWVGGLQTTLQGDPAQDLFNALREAGFPERPCGSEMAVQSESLICIRGGTPVSFRCLFILARDGRTLPDSNACPQHSIIGVGNVDDGE